MRKITNRQEADEFYRLVNSHIDEYIEKWHISPLRLKKYLSNEGKLNNFLSRTGLKDVDRIKTIINDVLEDREAILKDNIVKFENFEINESIKSNQSSIELEKVLADHFRTSLSNVELTDEKLHLYQVQDFDTKENISIYSTSDFENFKSQIIDIIIDTAMQENLEMHKLDLGLESGKLVKANINIPMSKFVDEQRLRDMLDNYLSEEKLLMIMTNWLNDYPILGSKRNFVYYKKINGHYLWLLVSK